MKVNDFSLSPNIPLSNKHQKLITKSKILLINLNSTITQLAKILILKGFNLYLMDKTIINQKDINSNYYLKQTDLYKSKAKIIMNLLSELTAVASITIISDITQAKDIKFACVGFRHFYELSHYEEYFTRKGIFFYCINSSGIYGFYYNNINRKKGKVYIDNLLFNRKCESYLESFKYNCKRNSALRSIHECIIHAIYLLNLYYKKNVSQKIVDLEIEREDIDVFQKKVFYIENYFKLNLIEISETQKEQLIDVIKKLLVGFNKEFSPLCVMMGKLVSDEIMAVLLGINKEPHCGIFTYISDSDKFDYIAFLES